MKVATLKDRELEKDFEEALKERDKRVYIFYLITSRTGFRQGDVLKLRVRDVKGKERLGLTEQKTNKYREVLIPNEVRRALTLYIKDKKERDYLFQSPRKKRKALDYTTIYKIMKEVGKEIGVYNIGTHTARKTYGYKIFSHQKSVGEAQLMLGHSNVRDTIEYIGVDTEYKDELTKKVFG